MLQLPGQLFPFYLVWKAPVIKSYVFFPFNFLANHDLCKVQQLQQYSNNGNNKTDLINLERKATAQRLRIKDNEGQGNCMFSALCHQLEIKKRLEYSEMELRTELVQYLTDHPTFVCICLMWHNYICRHTCKPLISSLIW